VTLPLRQPNKEMQALIDRSISHVLESYVTPEAAGVLIVGSIAEGFGNEGSDVDLILVTDTTEPLPKSASISFASNTPFEPRIEVSYFHTSEFSRIAFDLEEAAPGTEQCTERLRYYHLYAYGYIAKASPQLEAALQVFDTKKLKDMATAHFDILSTRQLMQMQTAHKLGRSGALRECAHEFARLAALRWCADHNETYGNHKWLPMMLARAKFPSSYDQALQFLLTVDQNSPDKLILESAKNFAGDIGLINASSNDRSEVRIQHLAGAVLWSFGPSNFLIVDCETVYKLSATAAKVWQKCDNTQLQTHSVSDLRVVATLHQNGLLKLVYPDFDWCELRRKFWTKSAISHLTVYGVSHEHDADEPLLWLPIRAHDLAESCLAMINHSMRIESWLEDSVGAFESENWELLAQYLRCMTQQAVHVIMCSIGHPSLPWLLALEKVDDLTSELPEFVEDAKALFGLRPSDRESAATAYKSVESFCHRVLQHVDGGSFVGIQNSPTRYVTAIGLAHEWQQLGNVLGVRFPNPVIDAALSEDLSLVAGTGKSTYGLRGEALAPVLQCVRGFELQPVKSKSS